MTSHTRNYKLQMPGICKFTNALYKCPASVKAFVKIKYYGGGYQDRG